MDGKICGAYFKIDNDENWILRLQVIVLSYIQDKKKKKVRFFVFL